MSIEAKEAKLCLSCMEEHEEEHEIEIIEVLEENIFKGELVKYPAKYEYCPKTESYTTTGKMMDEKTIYLLKMLTEKSLSQLAK